MATAVGDRSPSQRTLRVRMTKPCVSTVDRCGHFGPRPLLLWEFLPVVPVFAQLPLLEIIDSVTLFAIETLAQRVHLNLQPCKVLQRILSPVPWRAVCKMLDSLE